MTLQLHCVQKKASFLRENERVGPKALEKVLAATGEETVLCCTDYRRRPLMFLSPEEFSAVVKFLPALKEDLSSVQEKIDERDEVLEEQNMFFERRKYHADILDSRHMGRHKRNVDGLISRGRIGPRARA